MTVSELREHARECRDVATGMMPGPCRDVLIAAARDYERRADRIERIAGVINLVSPRIAA